MVMEILLISECFLIIALVVFLLASMRIISYRSVSMGLIGTSSLTLAITLVLVSVGTMWNIGFNSLCSNFKEGLNGFWS